MYKEGRVLTCYDDVIRRIKDACLRSGRDFEKVHLLAVTKYADVNDVSLLLSQRNIFAVGESKAQDSIKKWSAEPLKEFKTAKFFIGHLQSNKTAKIIENFDLICSLDTVEMARHIGLQAQRLNKKVGCLLQVKITQRLTQGGVPLEQAGELIKLIRSDVPSLELKGIMAIAPQTSDQSELRPLFRNVKKVFDDNFEENCYLSLGMSQDFETAVEEGSNLPRIGSAIFQ